MIPKSCRLFGQGQATTENNVRRAGCPFPHAARHLLPAAAALALLVLAARAQDAAPLDRIPPDGQPWRIERAADIPPTLATALRQADCRQDDATLSTFPVELFRPLAGSTPMAIAPCAGLRLTG